MLVKLWWSLFLISIIIIQNLHSFSSFYGAMSVPLLAWNALKVKTKLEKKRKSISVHTKKPSKLFNIVIAVHVGVVFLPPF